MGGRLAGDGIPKKCDMTKSWRLAKLVHVSEFGYPIHLLYSTPGIIIHISRDPHFEIVCMFRFPGIKWASKEVSIYVEHTEVTWGSARKIMVAADPSSYCGQETMVGVLWSWELDKVESWQAMCGGSATPGDLHRVSHT